MSAVLAVKPTMRVVLGVAGVVPPLVTERLMLAAGLVAGLSLRDVEVVVVLVTGAVLVGPLARTDKESVLAPLLPLPPTSYTLP